MAQQAAIKLDQKRVQVGPFFTPQVDPKVANPYGENSLLNNRLSVPGDATPRMSLINGISPDENRRTVGAPFVITCF